ncbi:MAG: hypothetical protein AAF845_02235 [Bacteroidota bacterium]
MPCLSLCPPRGRVLLALALAALTAAPAAAQWPTTEWVVEEDIDPDGVAMKLFGWGGAELARQTGPWFDREIVADKHTGMLQAASRWFESLGFAAPYQMTEGGGRAAGAGEAYLAYLKPDESDIGSVHTFPSGKMALTSHPGFLRPDSPMWTLMEASAIHELFHGIQGSTPGMPSTETPIPNCESPGVAGRDWLIEGSAAAVQIAWIEGQSGRYVHPFVAPGRAAWVRTFDQPLHRPSVPVRYRSGPARDAERAAGRSWMCSYGTWYFWYAAGEMLAQRDHERVAYLRYIFAPGRSWSGVGLEAVDEGLREAAQAFGSITPYQDGLYDLYPEFVAQYLTEDEFYETLEEVNLGAPDLFETTDASGGPLEPVSMRGWKVRVALPEISGSQPYAVRFTVDAPTEAGRDALHLIVDQDVIGRPVDPTAPYAHVAYVDAADGEAEFLVRVANVAEDVTATTDAAFSLRVEVDGFYGSDVAQGVGGELPPGFAVNGPEPWACRGGAGARAIFDLMTPDEVGRDVERALPEFAQDMEDMMDNMEIALQRAERMGRASGMSREQIEQMREQARAALAEAQSESGGEVAQAAADVRSQRTTLLASTFVGVEVGSECQVTLAATLRGREGGAQIIPGAVDPDRYPEDEEPGFALMVYPAAMLSLMRTAGGISPSDAAAQAAQLEDAMGGWEVCTMTAADRRDARESAGDCPPVLCTTGQLVLEEAAQGRIAGSFQFEVLRWPEASTGRCRLPEARQTVSGHFNVASTDDGFDDNSLGGFGLGASAGLTVPGAPILTFDDDD